MIVSEHVILLAKQEYEKKGATSIPFLQRKFKLSYSFAKELYNEITKTTNN